MVRYKRQGENHALKPSSPAPPSVGCIPPPHYPTLAYTVSKRGMLAMQSAW